MPLPLMPSAELFQPKPEPEPVARSTGRPDSIIPGCQCAMCVGPQPLANMATFDLGPPSIQNIPRAESPRDVPRGAVQGFQQGVYDTSALRRCAGVPWCRPLAYSRHFTGV